MNIIEEIPIIWKKPHNGSSFFQVKSINTLLHQFLQRYNKRLQISRVTIDLEMPKNAAGLSDKTYIIKLHLMLVTGEIIRGESEDRSIITVMNNITRQIDNQTRSTDRQKHTDSERKQ